MTQTEKPFDHEAFARVYLNKWTDGPEEYKLFMAMEDAVQAAYAFGAQQAVGQNQAVRDVLAERARQVSHEGWTPEHDDEHGTGEMAKAASCYAWMAAQSESLRSIFDTPPPVWPTEWSGDWWKPTTPRRDLVKAGALIIAEIERIDRAMIAAGEVGA